MYRSMNAHTLKVTHRSDLRPLPMRITKLQFERLQNVRARDGLAIQEHVRRALDIYLAGVDATGEPETGDHPEEKLRSQPKIHAR
jgi:hypothetical protein